MTTIIGIQEPKYCIVAADSQTTVDGRPYSSTTQPKIIEIGDYLLATAGMGLSCDVILHNWKPPVQRDDNPYTHMVTTVSPSMRVLLHKHDAMPTGEDTVQVLVAFKGFLFEIASDFTVLMRDDGFYGIGSGCAYAIGALHMGANVEEALRIAELNDVYTTGPFEIRKQVRSK